MYIDLVCCIDVGVTEELGQYLDIHALVATIRIKGMSSGALQPFLRQSRCIVPCIIINRSSHENDKFH